jgi:prepilin-type N-terminal cleavage/methylation domain-containing protein
VRQNKGFSLLELLIVVAIILVIATIAIPSLIRSRQTAHESAAVGNLKTLSSAEISYTVTSGGVYGDMPQLVGTQLVDSRFLSSMSGYDYSIGLAVNGRGFTAYATAITPDEGRFDYYTAPDWVIRYSDAASRAPSGMAGAPVHQ